MFAWMYSNKRNDYSSSEKNNTVIFKFSFLDKDGRKGCHGESSNEDWAKSGKAKRVRTIFTPEQLERLEAEFERQQYMVGTERYVLAFSSIF